MANWNPDLLDKILEVTDDSIWERFGTCLPEPQRTDFFNKTAQKEGEIEPGSRGSSPSGSK
jgi:hypothetical protein